MIGLKHENNIALDMKFKETCAIAEFLGEKQPITYLIYNFSSQTSQSNDSTFVSSILRFQKQMSVMRISQTKNAAKLLKLKCE